MVEVAELCRPVREEEAMAAPVQGTEAAEPKVAEVAELSPPVQEEEAPAAPVQETAGIDRDMEDGSLNVGKGADEQAEEDVGGEQIGDREGPGIDEVVDEVRRVLEAKRWDKSSNPFGGFDSPPGKF